MMEGALLLDGFTGVVGMVGFVRRAGRSIGGARTAFIQRVGGHGFLDCLGYLRWRWMEPRGRGKGYARGRRGVARAWFAQVLVGYGWRGGQSRAWGSLRSGDHARQARLADDDGRTGRHWSGAVDVRVAAGPVLAERRGGRARPYLWNGRLCHHGVEREERLVPDDLVACGRRSVYSHQSRNSLDGLAGYAPRIAPVVINWKRGGQQRRGRADVVWDVWHVGVERARAEGRGEGVGVVSV